MYVITGATGNTGRRIAERLLQDGQEVRVIGRNADRLRALSEKGAEPFVCNLSNTVELTGAFSGAHAVYAMIPPSTTSPDFREYQEQISDSLAAAIEKSGVKHVVSLSSVGADKMAGTGPVVGLHNLEEKLNRIEGLNVIHLRAGYFMENTLAQVDIIKSMGKAVGPLLPDLKLPMIATRDIGDAAADELLRLEFAGKQTRELLGQRDISMAEVTAIIGRAIGRPGLSYLHASDDEIRPALIQFGMSPDLANLILEMAKALNGGHMIALEPRSATNTTSTSFESFVAEQFVQHFRPSEHIAA